MCTISTFAPKFMELEYARQCCVQQINHSKLITVQLCSLYMYKPIKQ